MNPFTEKFNALKANLNADWQIEGNRAAFLIDGLAYDFWFEEETGNLMAYACVLEIPSGMQLPDRIPVLNTIYPMLLKAQFCFSETGGFSFALDHDQSLINLQSLIRLDAMTDDKFIAHIEKFVQFANVWSHRLENCFNEVHERIFSAGKPVETDESFFIRG